MPESDNNSGHLARICQSAGVWLLVTALKSVAIAGVVFGNAVARYKAARRNTI